MSNEQSQAKLLQAEQEKVSVRDADDCTSTVFEGFSGSLSRGPVHDTTIRVSEVHLTTG